jgi:hypothetical protein
MIKALAGSRGLAVSDYLERLAQMLLSSIGFMINEVC